MGIEISGAALWWLKAAAAAVALLIAYGSRAAGFRDFLGRFQSRTARTHAERSHQDSAWRELMDDSIHRQCATSVDLLNSWLAARTQAALDKETRESAAK